MATLSVEWGEVDWNTYVASLQGDNRRKQTARNRRRLQRMGTLVFEHSDAPARRQELIKWLFQHKVEQLARSERKSVWLDTNAYRDLLCSMAEPKSSLGCLMTFALVLDGTVLAALMARVDSGRLEMLNTVFHPEWGRLGPGGVLFEDTLRWACDRGVDFDMRIGDFPYKRAWSNREYPAITYEVVNSMWGTAYVTHRLSKERLRAIARRLPESLRHAAKRALRQSRSSA